MAEDETPLCNAIRDIVSKLEVIVMALNEVTDNPDIALAVVRAVLLEEFGEPLIEGNVGINTYRMIYQCHENGSEKYIEVELWSETGCGNILNHHVYDALTEGVVKWLEPVRLDVTITYRPDERMKRIIETVKKARP